MDKLTPLIQAHYAADNLFDRIIDAMAALGYDTDYPSVEALHLIDQLHAGGLDATRDHAKFAEVAKTMRVLDAGCGIGGSSRYLAKTYGCAVEAIDLTQNYVEVAKRLNRLCGLDELITVRQDNVTDLPFPDQSFDVVWCQNVGMNVLDKPTMFAEAYRVLAPGGRYLFSHIALGPEGEPYYPLPWANEPYYSFLTTPGQIMHWLDEVGFNKLIFRDETDQFAQPPAQRDGFGPSLVMGEDMPERQANAARSRKERRLVQMVVRAERFT